MFLQKAQIVAVGSILNPPNPFFQREATTDSFMLTNVNNSTLFKYKLKREGETKWRLQSLSTKNLRKISEQALYNLNWLGSRQLRKRL